MLDELQWPELKERRQQASLTFFYKIHNNLVIIDKNRYLSETGRGNRSTRSHSYLSIYLSIVTATLPREDYVQDDLRREDKRR